MHTRGLHWLDYLIIAAYAIGMLALGWYYKRKQQTADEYFVGNRNMPPFLIGISLFATLFSTVTYLSVPGEIIRHGPAFLGAMISMPIAYVIVGYCLIPAFMQYRLTSAYELLETRLGLSVRLTGAVMFIVLRMLWMAVLLNLAAKAMLVIFAAGDRWLLAMTAAIGFVALIYSTFGGLRAVVITDFVQFMLLFGGAVVIVVAVTLKLGGFSWFPTSWDDDWARQPLLTLDPFVRLTVVGTIIMQTVWMVCTFGSDQTSIQRFMATADAAAARRSFLVKTVAGIVVLMVLGLVGFSLLGYYRAFPVQLPSGTGIATTADRVFPHFIVHQLPIGLSGLVVSGIFAAAMSSIDSGVNSISAVIITDLVDRFRKKPLTATWHTHAARLVAFLVGVIVIASSTLIDHVHGNFFEVSKRLADLLVTPIFTLFLMALFVRFATPVGTISGAICGFLTAILIAFWDPLVSDRSISINWISPCALIVSFSVGCLVSWLTRSAANLGTRPDNQS